MYMERPVIACNSGGPLETVGSGAQIPDQQRGFLCRPQPEEFATAMRAVAERPSEVTRLGKNGRVAMLERFSFQAFAQKLLRAVQREMAQGASGQIFPDGLGNNSNGDAAVATLIGALAASASGKLGRWRPLPLVMAAASTVLCWLAFKHIQ